MEVVAINPVSGDGSFELDVPIPIVAPSNEQFISCATLKLAKNDNKIKCRKMELVVVDIGRTLHSFWYTQKLGVLPRVGSKMNTFKDKVAYRFAKPRFWTLWILPF